MKKVNSMQDSVLVYFTVDAIHFRTRLDQDTVIKVFGISFKDYCESLIKNTMVNNASKVRFNYSFHLDNSL